MPTSSDTVNDVMRDLYRPKSLIPKYLGRDPTELRRALAQSKRFILDESMSAFLAHISCAPFKVAHERRPDILTSLRVSARLPHPKVFIQYDGAAFRKELIAMGAYGFDDRPLAPPEEVVPHPGLFLEETEPEVIRVSYFGHVELNGKMEILSLPFVYLYRTDNNRFPTSYDLIGGAISHGVIGWNDSTCAVRHTHDPIPSEWKISVTDDEGKHLGYTNKMVGEFGGMLRYIFAFLATLNDVPTIRTETRPSKGYVARGQYRKYLDQTVIHLSLPRKMTLNALAKRVVVMSRRRWHQVEPHWRITKKPNGWICEPMKHLWQARDEAGYSHCSVCAARRTWIVLPHGRGDIKLGMVRHPEVHITHGV